MSLVKAKCLKCEQIIEINGSEDAGICPKCGAAFVTEKVINNFKTLKTGAQKSNLPSEFVELQEKYDAFVKLYNFNNSEYFHLFTKEKDILESVEKTNKLVNEHNEQVKNAQKWNKKYNSRVDNFNDKKYTAGADSWSEQLHRKYVNSAMDKYKEVGNDIDKLKSEINAEKQVTARLKKEKEQMLVDFKQNYLKYNNLAHAVVEEMCKKFPSNPISYLYAANWYAREIKINNNFLEFVNRVGCDYNLMLLINNQIKNHNFEAKYNAEIEKSKKFMTEQIKSENSELIKKLIGNKTENLPKTANNNSSAVTQKNISVKNTTKTGQNKKSSSTSNTKNTNLTKNSTKTSSNTKSKPKKQKISWFNFSIKIIEFLVGAGVLAGVAVGGYYLLKWLLKF